LIREFILEEDRAAPPFAALFALNMLVGTSTETPTPKANTQLDAEAGLGSITRPDPDGDVLVAAQSG